HDPVSDGSKGRLAAYWFGKSACGMKESRIVVCPWVAVTSVGGPDGVTSTAPNTRRSPGMLPTVFGPTWSRRLKVLETSRAAHALDCGQAVNIVRPATIPIPVRRNDLIRSCYCLVGAQVWPGVGRSLSSTQRECQMRDAADQEIRGRKTRSAVED